LRREGGGSRGLVGRTAGRYQDQKQEGRRYDRSEVWPSACVFGRGGFHRMWAAMRWPKWTVRAFKMVLLPLVLPAKLVRFFPRTAATT